MVKQQETQITDYITDVVKNKKPVTIYELIQVVQQKYPLTQIELTDIILQMETEHKINFSKATKTQPAAKKLYVTSKNTLWFWSTIALAIAAVVAVFIIPEDTYPLTYLRQVVTTIFLVLLPGYAFLKVLYPKKIPRPTSTENLDMMERMALSIGLSIALVAINGLVFNYTSWGIRLTPITLSLFVMTIIFASIGVFREYTQK